MRDDLNNGCEGDKTFKGALPQASLQKLNSLNAYSTMEKYK